MSAPLVYWNGELRAAHEARFASDDHGVLFGVGFFETFRTCGGVPHRWPAHQLRLLTACERTGIDVPPTFLARDPTAMQRAVQQLLRDRSDGDAVFRYTITAGAPAGNSYPRPSELLVARALPAPAAAEGATLRVLRLPRDNGEWVPRPKSLNFANTLLGARELQTRTTAMEDEGLFLSRENGCVVEAVRHNVAWFEGDRFCFPAPELGAVDGVCLRWALEFFRDAEPRRASLADLARADAVVLLNSVRGVTPVHELWDTADRERLKTWRSHAHPRVAELIGHWRDALGENCGSGFVTQRVGA
jgi:4-amino-4-deoxychorismate lyase